MNGEISTGASRCSTRRKTHAQKTLPSRLLASLIIILSAAPLVALAQNRALDFDGVDAKQSAGGNAGDGHLGSPIFGTRTSNRLKITEPQKERKKMSPKAHSFQSLVSLSLFAAVDHVLD